MEDKAEPPPVIKHLVIAGGGIYGLAAYGALKETNKRGLWDIKNIESCYCTSIGGIIATIIFLGYDWDTLDAYIIKRPWNEVFKYDIHTLLNAYTNCGIFDKSVFETTFKPLFAGADIDINITLGEFYEKTGVDMHFYTCELNTFQLKCLSHKTHPEWKVIDAIYTSSSIPIFLKPLCVEGECFIDGGLLLNYPLAECLKNNNVLPSEILGINKVNPVNNYTIITSESNLVDYSIQIFNKLMDCALQDMRSTLLTGDECSTIENQIDIWMDPIAASDLYEFTCSEKHREDIIQIGVKSARTFLDKGLL